MKNQILLVIFSSFLFSCGESKNNSVESVIQNGDLEKIRTKRTEIVNKKQEVIDQLKLLDNAISALDTVKKLPLVTVHKVKDSLFEHYLELQGNVTTKNMVVIYPEFSGVLTRILVREGQRVLKDQLLAKIDDGGLSQQLAQLQIQRDLAKTTYERQKRLWEQKIGSEIQYLQAKTNYEAQDKVVDQLKSQIGKTMVRAPFTGIIDDVISEQGSVVAPGQTALMRIINLDHMYVEAEVPESHISSISKGKFVEVYFPVLNKSLNARIRQVANFINPNNRSFKIEVDIPNSKQLIKPNLTAKLKINDYTNDHAILIPLNIISEDAMGDQYVYITTDEDKNNTATANRLTIKTGLTQGDYVEILSGIENGNNIIEEGARSIKNGQKVKIIK